MALDEIAGTYARYREAKRTHGVIDLGDLLTGCAEVLERDTAAAAAARWRIRHLFVDEFQDMNPAQFRLLSAWLGGRSDLFAVGDPRQAVYGWNGADPTLLERLPELLPGTTVLRLDANHRSSPQVIAAARAVLGGRARPGAADLPADSADSADSDDSDNSGDSGDSGDSGGIGTPGSRPDGPVPTVAGFEDDAEEATAVVRWLRRMHRPGRPWSHLAVLARTNARLAPVAAALRDAGIPHRVGSSPEASAEIRAAIALLGAGPRERPLRSALADLSLADPSPVELSPADDGSDAGARSGPSGLPGTLLKLADEHAVEDPGATVGGFLAWLAATVDEATPASEADPGACAVELSTFHRAKGLEWPAVALVGLEDGMVPISYATSPAARAEERRLLYVAVTRAEENLWCSWAMTRQAAGRSWSCRPSPFLTALEAAGAGGGLTDHRAFATRMASLRACLPATLPVAG
jgi:DNA helicase-2/ATP-dependent DNA helicase PcrA